MEGTKRSKLFNLVSFFLYELMRIYSTYQPHQERRVWDPGNNFNAFGVGDHRTNRCGRRRPVPKRWRSGESVRIAVGRPGINSSSRVIPKDFKNGIHSFPAWRSALKRDSVVNKPASLLVVSLGKALNGTLPPLCGRQVAHPYFTRLQL